MLDVKLKLKPGHTSERSWLEPSPLRQLFWNITSACNYRCKICFTDAGQHDPEELSTEESKRVVERAHTCGVGDIIISGGEPFMRDDLLEILGHMAELGMTARIASNGSLLTDSLLARMQRNTLTKSFQIGLDTVDPDLYGEVHGTSPDALWRALDAVRCVQKHGFHTTVSVRLTPQTLETVPELLDYASAEGWATVTVHLPVHTRRIEGAFPQDADLLTLLDPVLEHFVSLPERWLVETYIPWAPYHPSMRRLAKHIRVVHRGCRAGRDRLTVNSTGWLSPCVCMNVSEAYVGNVRRDDMREVFESSPLCRMMRQPWQYGICTDCPQVTVCGGGCRASALALSGKLDGLDGSCPLRESRTGVLKEHADGVR